MAAAAPLSAAAVLNAAKAKNVPVGLELYSVRGELAKDLLGTVAAVGKMGYQVVEFYAPYLDWTPDTAKSVRKVLDDTGLKCHSTHNNGPSFTPDGMKKAIELNQIIGSTRLIMASAPRVDDRRRHGRRSASSSPPCRRSSSRWGWAPGTTTTRWSGGRSTASARWT